MKKRHLFLVFGFALKKGGGLNMRGKSPPRPGSGRNLLFPREAVPSEIGKLVRNARRDRNMTQARLALKTGVTRWAIMRLEAGRHIPGSHLVHALERALRLGEGALVSGWKEAAPHGAPARGPRARRARIALGYTLSEIAAASGISIPTISRFERELGDTPLILGPDFDRNDGFTNDAYARAHHFADASEMETYARSPSLERWLADLVSRQAVELRSRR